MFCQELFPRRYNAYKALQLTATWYHTPPLDRSSSLAQSEADSEPRAVYTRRETRLSAAQEAGHLLSGDIKGCVWSGIVAVSFHGYILARIYWVVPRYK